jgi:hypothetical protein
MTTMTRRRIVLGVLLLAAAVTAALAVDVIHRVLAWHAFDVADRAVLLAFESLRVLLIAGGVTLALLAERRSTDAPALAAFGTGALLLALAAARALTGPMPGPGQQALATALLDHGLPQTLLGIVFVHAEWVAWLALPPLLRFAATYPRTVTPGDVLASGRADRRGALRNVTLAGTDVGVLARRIAARLLERGWLESRRLWAFAVVMAAAHTAALLMLPRDSRSIVQPAAAGVAALVAAVVIALLRAGFALSESGDRAFLRRLRTGTAAAAALVLVVVALEIVPVGGFVGAVALYLAPLALIAGALAGLLAVRSARPPVGIGRGDA